MLIRVLWVLLVWGRVQAADWPRFLGPAGDGTSPETGLVDRIPTNGLPVRFDLPVGTGYAAPSVTGDALVLFHRRGNEEIVERWSATTGVPVWAHRYPSSYRDPYGYNNGPRCAPLIEREHVFTFGAEGRLTCLELATGRRVWQRDTAKEWRVPEAFFGVGSTPLIEGGKLIVMLGGQPNSGVVAFDPATGKTLWESVGAKNWEDQPMLDWPGERTVEWRDWEKQASYASPVAATVNGERLLYCLMRQGLVALSPVDGTVKFSRWFRARVDESVNAANPVVFGDRVLISSAYYRSGSVLLQVAPGNTGFSEAWKGLSLEMHWATPILLDGHLYGFSGRNEPDARLRCVEFATGRLKWERDERWSHRGAEQPPVFGRGSFTLADGKLIALGEGGLLGLFQPHPERCLELGRWQVPSLRYPCWAGPVLADGVLFLRSEDRLVALKASK